MKIELLKKPFLSNSDICAILDCSSAKASRIKRIIEKNLNSQGKKMITNDVPTYLFKQVMNLDEKAI
jgi:DNA polymerase III delta subunit